MIELVNQTNISIAASIYSISWKDSHRAFCSPAFVEAHTPERQQAFIQGKIDSGSVFYLLKEDVPVGIVSVKGNIIEDLYVLPDRQNKGYGTKLLNFAIEKCNGTPTLWILENNVKAKRLYRNRGFRETGNVKSVPNGLDEIEFALHAMHSMKLTPAPFDMIRSGQKTIEMRLNDEKRSKINIGDTITFLNTQTGQTIDCLVKAVYRYDSFKELYAHHDKLSIGYTQNQQADPDDMLEYYSPEDIKKYGVVGIEISVLD